jgi:hypothetical protein
MDQKPKESNEEHVKSINAKIKALKKEKTTYKNGESFSINKLLKGMFSILNPVEWAKTLREIGILDVRKWIIYALIIGSIYGYGYFKGIGNKPVNFDLQGKEATIALNEHYLKIERDGTAKVVDKEGEVLKVIKTKDIPELRKALKPIGFQLKPIGILGMGLGNDKGVSAEGGAGVSWFKFYRANIDSFLTNRGLYPFGVSYKLDQIGLKNSSVGVGGGKGFKGDTRGIFYYKWEF